MMRQGRRPRSNKQQKSEMISSRSNINLELSYDTIRLIFSKLSLFNLLTCRLVCEAWNNLVLTLKTSISNLFFAHISPYPNRNLHYVELDPQHLDGFRSVASFSIRSTCSSTMIKILTSCNGLLLYSSFLLDSTTFERSAFVGIHILNPMTNEYFELPMTLEDSKVSYYYGFGFGLKTKHYKVVRYSFVRHKSAILIEIFTFGTRRQWSHVGFVPFALDGHGTYFNGALYWVGIQQRVGLHQRPFPKLRQLYTNFIARFDVENEKFEEFSFPEYGEYSNGYPSCCFFMVLNDTLYLTFQVWKLSQYQVWKMKEDYSWIKAFVVPMLDGPVHLNINDQITGIYYRSYHLQLIKVCEDGKILCLYAGYDLILYDPKTGTTQKLTQDVQIKKHLLFYQIDCFNFDPLHKILVGDVEC